MVGQLEEYQIQENGDNTLGCIQGGIQCTIFSYSCQELKF